MRRQAVHEDRVGARKREQLLVDLVRAKLAQALLALGVLAHGDPHVGVDRMRAAHRVARILADLDRGAGGPRQRLCVRDHLRRRRIAGR